MGLGSRIPDPGVKKAPHPGSRIRIPNTPKKLSQPYAYILVANSAYFGLN
jgi:hypothetical protein